jgi:hypothetical protein
MEEIEIRDALRRHVLDAEPPLGLSAAGLLGEGRRRQRWRIGLGLTSGSAATALLVLGTFTLAPAGGPPVLDSEACALPMARDYHPGGSAPPTYMGPTGVPSPGWPSSSPMDWPSANPSETAVQPTESAAQPTVTPVQPTDTPSVPPTDGPGPSFHPTPGASPSSGLATPVPTQTSVLAAKCYLAEKLKQVAPGARFAPGFGGRPFEFHGGASGYAANGIIVKGDSAAQLDLMFEPPKLVAAHDEFDGWKRDMVAGAVVYSLRRDDGLLMIEAHLPHTTAMAFMTGHLISDGDLIALLVAPELDICG